VRFSASDTRVQVAALGGAASAELDRRGGRVPVPRLLWPVADELSRSYPRAVFTLIGVLDSFVVLVDDEPSGPDHDLADEEQR